MRVQIGQHSVESDGTCITLKINKPNSKDPEKTVTSVVGYFPSLGSAVTRLLDERMAQPDVETVSDLMATLKATKEDVLQACEAIAEAAGLTVEYDIEPEANLTEVTA